MVNINDIADATWTTYEESSSLEDDDKTRVRLAQDSFKQWQVGLVSWGGYVFHVYNEIAEKHSISLSEYPVPGSHDSTIGYRVQNKINQPSEVVLDVMMVSTGALSTKSLYSAPIHKYGWRTSSFFDAMPWVYFPSDVGGIIVNLKEAMYKGWALTYNGKYGRIRNMIITSIQTKDNEKTVYGCPIRIHLKQVLGINHRAVKKPVSYCSAPTQSPITR